MGKVNQYGTSEGIENIKFLGTDENQTVNVPYKTIEERMLEFATATHDKNGLMSKEDKVKLDELGEGSVTGVKGNAETRYRTGNVNLTPANVGAVSKAGDTMTGHLHLGNDTMTNSPNIYWNDKNRSIWAGTANSEGAFYLWDATNGKGIIISNPGGADNRFLGTASGNLPLTGGKVNGTIQAGDKAWLFTDGEGGTLQILSHDGKYGYHMDGCLDDGIRLYVYQVNPWVYKGEMILDINGGLHASGGFKGTADVAVRVTNDYKNMAFHWNGQAGQPSWLWGGNDGENMYVWNPSNFSVNYANSAGSANSVAWSNVSGKPSSYPPATHSHGYLPLSGGTLTGTLSINQSGVSSSFFNAADALCINASNIRYAKIFCGEQVFMQHGADQGYAWAGCTAGGFFTGSSRRYKENISNMTNDMAKKILKVNVVTFDYKKNVMIESQRYGHSGVLAEPTDEIIPEVVMHREIDGNIAPDGVDYAKFTPYLIKMVQIQQDEIDALKAENASLAESLAKIQEKLDDITRNTR